MSNPKGINQYTGRGAAGRSATRSDIQRVASSPKGSAVGSAQRSRLAKDIVGVAKLAGISKHKALRGIAKAAVQAATFRNSRK